MFFRLQPASVAVVMASTRNISDAIENVLLAVLQLEADHQYSTSIDWLRLSVCRSASTWRKRCVSMIRVKHQTLNRIACLSGSQRASDVSGI